MAYDRIYNFSAGPAALPEHILEHVRDEMLNYRGSGMSVLEMSHRSPEVIEIIENAEKHLRTLLNIPSEYAVVFNQGGASLQFAMAPMNLSQKGKPVSVLHTGYWTQKAIGEIKKFSEVSILASGENEGFKSLPSCPDRSSTANSSYLHMCTNNTIYGTQWQKIPPMESDAPIVCDMSSDFLSRPFEMKQFGMVFAGAQKNVGPSGLAIVIIRKDLAERCDENAHSKFLQYRSHIEADSAYNTPNVFGIYFAEKVFAHLIEMGGLARVQENNEKKAATIYSVIDDADFYSCPIAIKDRSRMNIVMRIRGGNEDLEKKFNSEATTAGLSGLKGHRAIGGLRASIYNAQSQAGVDRLATFMKDFARKNG